MSHRDIPGTSVSGIGKSECRGSMQEHALVGMAQQGVLYIHVKILAAVQGLARETI